MQLLQSSTPFLGGGVPVLHVFVTMLEVSLPMLAWIWSVPSVPLFVYVKDAWPFASVVLEPLAPASGPLSTLNWTVAAGAGAPLAVVAVAVTVWLVPGGFVALGGASVRLVGRTSAVGERMISATAVIP